MEYGKRVNSSKSKGTKRLRITHDDPIIRPKPTDDGDWTIIMIPKRRGIKPNGIDAQYALLTRRICKIRASLISGSWGCSINSIGRIEILGKTTRGRSKTKYKGRIITVDLAYDKREYVK